MFHASIGNSDETAIAAGFEHGLAVVSGGQVRAWGGNASGQLGDTTTQPNTIS